MTKTGHSKRSSFHQAAQTFEELGWLFPAYYQMGYVIRLAAEIDKEPTPDAKHTTLARALEKMYDAPNLATMLLDRYSKIPYISDFTKVISDAIEAFHLGLTHAAIASLIPVVEGVMRRIALGLSVPFKQKNIHARLLATIDALVKKQRTDIPEVSEERVIMLMGFRRFVDENLFINTDKHQKIGALNRNGILHGIYNPSEYGYEYNFFKIISIIDITCFFLSLQTSGVSALAPDLTNESRKLANYYLMLRALARQRDIRFAGKVPVESSYSEPSEPQW